MHEIERTDRFTLVGGDARLGKLTLFEAAGPRDAGVLERVVLRVADPGGGGAARRGRGRDRCGKRDDHRRDGAGLALGLVRAERRGQPTSTTSSCACRAPSRPWPGSRSSDSSATATDLQSRARSSASVRGMPRGRAAAPQPSGVPGRQCRRRRARGAVARARDRGRRRRTEHAGRVRLGPRPDQARVRRAQAGLLARLRRSCPISSSPAPEWPASSPRRRRPRAGASVVVHEKGDRPGGSMLLSSGVVWRHRDLEDFRRECPGGDPELQRLVHERLDDDLAWLERLGARSSRARPVTPRRSASASTRAR